MKVIKEESSEIKNRGVLKVVKNPEPKLLDEIDQRIEKFRDEYAKGIRKTNA